MKPYWYRGVITALVLAAFSINPAYSGRPVFDASNFVKNSRTAMQTHLQHVQMLNDYAMQANQYMAMMRNLERMPVGILNTAIGREIVAAAAGNPSDPGSWGGLQPDDLRKASSEIYNTYKTSARLMNEGARLYEKAGRWGMDMNRHSAASGMSWEQIFRHEQERARAGQELNRWRYQQAQDMTRQMQGFQQRADQQIRAAGEARGAVHALGAIAALNHTMTDQLSSLIASSARREAEEARQNVEIDKVRDRQYQISLEARRASEASRLR